MQTRQSLLWNNKGGQPGYREGAITPGPLICGLAIHIVQSYEASSLTEANFMRSVHQDVAKR